MTVEEIRQMAKSGRRQEAIDILSRMLDEGEGNREEVLLELGVLYNSMADTTKALNCLNEVLRMNPGNTKARTYVQMINGILNYYCKDLLNP